MSCILQYTLPFSNINVAAAGIAAEYLEVLDDLGGGGTSKTEGVSGGSAKNRNLLVQ